MSITLVLQLIVIISIFNIAAFMIFISEKKAQDFFMFRALGLDSRGLLKFWLLLVLFIWINSCAISIGLTHFFDRYLLKLPFLQIPGEIYVLGDLSLSLHGIDYLVVFGLSLLWVMIVTSAGFLRLKKKSILYGLRQEFS
jgi:ABC-type antimicrobial peptide transport system permease subunit